MSRITAAAVLALSGPSRAFGRDGAAGLAAWAHARDARLVLVDSGVDPRRCAREVERLARSCDLLFGPYGSGLTRAAATAAGDAVLWNHGGAAVPRGAAKVVDILGPAERYWEGLAAVLTAAGLAGPVAVLVGPSPFARAVAEGALRSLGAAGLASWVRPHTPAEAASAIAEGAGAIVGCGRPDEDAALGRSLVGCGLPVGLVLCGVDQATSLIGPQIEGWIGPAQWAGDPLPPLPLPGRSQYPAAQALAAALIAESALLLAGSTDPDALWTAARALRTQTFFGPYAVDDQGRQLAHAPVLVRWRGAPLRREVVWRPPPGSL